MNCGCTSILFQHHGVSLLLIPFRQENQHGSRQDKEENIKILTKQKHVIKPPILKNPE